MQRYKSAAIFAAESGFMNSSLRREKILVRDSKPDTGIPMLEWLRHRRHGKRYGYEVLLRRQDWAIRCKGL